MADQVPDFIDGDLNLANRVKAAWLNDANKAVYRANTGISGATPNRTLLSKLSDLISVKDFGAVGDGVTDDTAAFVAAEAALLSAGGKIFIPPGTYILTNWTPTHNDMVIQGSGRWATVLKGSGAGAATFNATGISRLRFSDIRIDGNSVKTNAVDIHATASLTQAVEHTWENVYFTGATTDNLSIGDSGNHQASQLTFLNCAAWGGTPSNSNIKIQGGNALGISWYGGQIGSQAIVKNVDMQGGEFTANNNDWNGATGYDVVITTGQLKVFGGHSESAAFLNTSAADVQTDQSAISMIEGFTCSTSGATSIYHQSPRTLRIVASFFNGNVRVGNGAILEGDSIRFGGASGYVEDAGAINRIPRTFTWTPTVAGQTAAGTGQTYTTQSGWGERTGKIVTAHYSIVLTNRGNGTGNLLIGGLPYPIATIANAPGPCSAGNVTYPAGTTSIQSLADSGFTTTLFLVANGTGVATAFVQIDTNVTNTSTLRGSITYQTSN